MCLYLSGWLYTKLTSPPFFTWGGDMIRHSLSLSVCLYRHPLSPMSPPLWGCKVRGRKIIPFLKRVLSCPTFLLCPFPSPPIWAPLSGGEPHPIENLPFSICLPNFARQLLTAKMLQQQNQKYLDLITVF